MRSLWYYRKTLYQYFHKGRMPFVDLEMEIEEFLDRLRRKDKSLRASVYTKGVDEEDFVFLIHITCGVFLKEELDGRVTLRVPSSTTNLPPLPD